MAVGMGFDLALFVEVMVKASTQADVDHAAGLTNVERFMGVPKWYVNIGLLYLLLLFSFRTARYQT
jgi:hypothetical protein